MPLPDACCAEHALSLASLLRARSDADREPRDDAPARDAGSLPLPAGTEVAYVMNGFPRLSETFIANEIHLLETLGLQLRLYSVKREGEPQQHPVVDRINAPLNYLPHASSLSGSSLGGWLARNLPTFARAQWQVIKRHPLRYAATLASALAFAVRWRPGPWRLRKVFIKEFLQAGWVAADVLRQGRVGHLHGHFCHGVATITWFASRMTGIPFSFTAHAKDIYQAELNPGDLLERKLGAARFVATCTAANAQVLTKRAPDARVVHTIYHGLDTEWFKPQPAAAREAAPLILAVGRFVEKKGFDHLVDACAQLEQAGVPFRCRIVGEQGPAYAPLRAQIAELGLEQHIELHGPVTQDALRDIYREAALFALPCQVMADGDRDGIPNVLAEAMASGVPVVSTRISGIPELIDDRVHGLLVPPQDSEALADALRALLTDHALHAQLAQAGRQRICDVFDSHRTTVALRNLFVAQLQARTVTA
jgi:glycosyltransferase involved in cell wall biosynthesis